MYREIKSKLWSFILLSSYKQPDDGLLEAETRLMPLKYKVCLTDMKDDFNELCDTRITCQSVWPSWSSHLRQSDFYLQANPEKKVYNSIIKWMHYRLTFIFKLTNDTNCNCHVISVILLKYDKDVTVQHNCNLHVLYSEMACIRSATMYEFGLLRLIISHCNAMYMRECSLCDVLFHIAKYHFVVFYFVCYENISQILHYTSWSLIVFS